MEQHTKREEDQCEGREPGDVHKQAQEQHDAPGVLGKVDDRDQGGANLHHGVTALTLGGMTRLVAGHGNACDRSARTVSVREIQVVILRVVVVGELTGNALDTHGVATVGVEHAASDRGTRVAVRANLGPGLVRRVDIALRRKTKHRTNKDNQQVQRVDAKAVTIVIGHANSSESNYTLEAFYPIKRLGFLTAIQFCHL